ncbi:hypothetical protein XPA_005667 [Xanthoria parietina]
MYIVKSYLPLRLNCLFSSLLQCPSVFLHCTIITKLKLLGPCLQITALFQSTRTAAPSPANFPHHISSSVSITPHLTSYSNDGREVALSFFHLFLFLISHPSNITTHPESPNLHQRSDSPAFHATPSC